MPLASVAARFHWLAGETGGEASTSSSVCKVWESKVQLPHRTRLASCSMSCSLAAARSILEQLEARGGREGAVLAGEFYVSGRPRTSGQRSLSVSVSLYPCPRPLPSGP